MNNLFKGVALVIGGALLGAATALLLTPKTGEEVREQLSGYAEDAKKRLQDYCEQLKQNLAEANAAPEPEAKPAK